MNKPEKGRMEDEAASTDLGGNDPLSAEEGLAPDLQAEQAADGQEPASGNEWGGETGGTDVGAQSETPPEAENLDDEELRLHLAEELGRLIERVRAATPDYTPPPFSAKRLLRLIEQNLMRFSPEMRLGILEKLRQGVSQDLFDLDTWRGVWYMINYSIEYQADILKRRLTGQYETDEWGLDTEVLQAIKPFFDFMYKTYWRVETTGMENIPAEGRALLVCNHSGQLPWDGSMIGTAVLNEHPGQRLVRSLYGDWLPTLPFVSSIFVKLGQVLANEENGVRLLEQDQLVAVFPEGYKGIGKLFKDRYRLARFGRGGFIRMALKAGSPVIPVSVVGAEETYISLAKSDTIARMIHFPYFPISPTFPWFGLLGFIPLPTKWYIDFGEPIHLGEGGAEAARDITLVSQLTDQVRNSVQQLIYTRLAQRRSIFLG
jgi:1-acyl-sn-glycerol-3-phosphate acyltransferase